MYRYTLENYTAGGDFLLRRKVHLKSSQIDAPVIDFTVLSSENYRKLQPGDPVCLAVRRGALGIRQVSAGPCPPR